MDITLSLVEGLSNKHYYRKEEKHNVKEIPWIKEYVKGGDYYVEKYNKYEHDNEILDILHIKTPIPNAEAMKIYTQKKFKQEDPYDIKLSTIIQKAEEKTYDYIHENRDDYFLNKTLEKITKISREDVEWFKREGRITDSFVRMCIAYYGDTGDEWDETSKSTQSLFRDKFRDLHQKLANELGLYK